MDHHRISGCVTDQSTPQPQPHKRRSYYTMAASREARRKL